MLVIQIKEKEGAAIIPDNRHDIILTRSAYAIPTTEELQQVSDHHKRLGITETPFQRDQYASPNQWLTVVDALPANGSALCPGKKGHDQYGWRTRGGPGGTFPSGPH